MTPSMSARNFTPTSTAFGSGTSTSHGTADPSQIVQGQLAGVTVIVVGVFAPSRLPLSSTARLRILAVPSTPGLQLKLQLSRPMAGCHLAPPSTDTSTALTAPPPPSLAVPVMVTDVSAAMLAPL